MADYPGMQYNLNARLGEGVSGLILKALSMATPFTKFGTHFAATLTIYEDGTAMVEGTDFKSERRLKSCFEDECYLWLRLDDDSTFDVSDDWQKQAGRGWLTSVLPDLWTQGPNWPWE